MRHRRCGWAGPFVEAVVPRQPWSVSFLFIYVRFFSSCPLSTKEQKPLTPTSITGRFWCWSPAPLSRHRLDHRGGRSPTLGPPHPSLWARLGSVIYPSLNTERCLEVLLQQLLCISMPTATLLNSFFFFFSIPETGGAESVCCLRISRALWLFRVSLPAFSGRHWWVSRASIWPVVHVLNSYLHSLSPFSSTG